MEEKVSHFGNRLAIMLLIAATGAPAAAQSLPQGHVSKSSVGIAGQRQTREQTNLNVAPMDRVESRIQNRIQARIRNRIDRYYDPKANAVSPFVLTGERVRNAGRPRGR